jgi:hypothetical protein
MSALEKIGDEVETEICFHPFELNPAMPTHSIVTKPSSLRMNFSIVVVLVP